MCLSLSDMLKWPKAALNLAFVLQPCDCCGVGVLVLPSQQQQSTQDLEVIKVKYIHED